MMLEFDGLDELIETIKQAEDTLGDRIGEVVKNNIDEIFQETQRRVPRKTGALKESGKIVPIDRTGSDRSYAIQYGDSDVDRVGVFYAAAVHEIMDAEHDPPTGPKYVEGPLNEGIEKFKKDLAKAAQRALGKKTL